MRPVRMDTDTCAVPFSGVAWLMVTTDAPAAEMPARSSCSAPVSSSSVALSVMTSRPLYASKMQSLYL